MMGWSLRWESLQLCQSLVNGLYCSPDYSKFFETPCIVRSFVEGKVQVSIDDYAKDGGPQMVRHLCSNFCVW